MNDSDFNARFKRLEAAKDKVTSSKAESTKFVNQVAQRVKAAATSKSVKK